MKGVIATRAPGAAVVDVSHGIPAQDVLAGALVLAAAVPYFPVGTVHVAVVDPGVGSARRAICVETDAGLLVGPDNGVLSLAASPASVRRIVHLTDERFFLTPRSHTFHGRDVFAPVAAALAGGTDPSALGPPLPDLVRLRVPEPTVDGERIRGEVIYVDHFGNLVTNVATNALPGGAVVIRLGSTRMSGIAASYAATAVGQPVAVINSWGLLEIAVRDASARAMLGAGVGDEVLVEPAGA
jgi:hypothetical protein